MASRRAVHTARTALGITGGWIAAALLARWIGPGTLASLLLGRSTGRSRRSATAIAAALGPLRFNDFKNDFFHDIAEPILRIHEQKDRYLARYGIVPDFKAGIHGGTVVTAELGDIKKDIVHSGDTVNTAARVEAQCRPLERRVLVSGALLGRCRVPGELEVEDMGERELRGKAEALRLYRVRSRAYGVASSRALPG